MTNIGLAAYQMTRFDKTKTVVLVSILYLNILH